jgi:2-polyprenyl-3-methyl-5-hydroxy-6-metoxy-1,4-benzoquinol methylase
MSLDCPLCERSQPHETIGTRDRDGNDLHTILCLFCGLGRTHPIPSQRELADFYSEHYRREYKGVERPSAHHVLRAGRLALTRLNMLRDAVAAPNARILDCGSGGGEFLYLARRMGCQPQGIEPNQGYAAYARQELELDIECGMLENLEIPAARYDLVTMFHVLEHIGSTVAYLRRAASALASPQSILAVEVPNLTAGGSHPRSRYHRAHLYHFTESTLTAAGAKAGLHAIRSGHTEDGTNVWAHFRVAPGPVFAAEPAEQVFRRLQDESVARYYLSPPTWARTVARVARQTQERWTARRWPSGRAILDSLPLPPQPD